MTNLPSWHTSRCSLRFQTTGRAGGVQSRPSTSRPTLANGTPSKCDHRSSSLDSDSRTTGARYLARKVWMSSFFIASTSTEAIGPK